MTRRFGTTLAAVALGFGVSATAPARAVGGSFHCESSSLTETAEHVDGSFGLIQIVNQYVLRWDAAESLRQCQAYAAGRPSDISCLNDRRDWEAVLASVPQDYFGRSNQSLAPVVREEIRKGNGLKEAMDYCRSVGAIK